MLECTYTSACLELKVLSCNLFDIDDVPLSVSFSSVGSGCSPRFKAEESCRNFLADDGSESIPSVTRDLLR